jgi:hypothetical protein
MEAALVEVETEVAHIEEETAAVLVREPAAVASVAALGEVRERGGV